MKSITIVAQVNPDLCIGCRTCEKVCPVNCIAVIDKKAKVNPEKCMGCANCEQRCPTYAIIMAKKDVPREVGVDVTKFDQQKIRELCEKAHLNPEQVICYCVGVRAEEVAAALLAGAKTPEEVSAMTGVRTGCTIECIQPVLRLVEAAGLPLVRNEKGWQWYGTTVTAWDLPEGVKEKFGKGFYFDQDRELLDREVYAGKKGGADSNG